MAGALLQATKRLRSVRLLEELTVGFLYGLVKVLAALPTRWVMRLGDGLGWLLTRIDQRGRAAAFQNMQIAFGDAMSRAEREKLLLASMRNVMRSMLLLFHLQPLTPKRYRAWVSMGDAEQRRAHDFERVRARGAVFVSGHIGNWELLLGLRLLFPHYPPSVFLAEEIEHDALNRLLKKLRSHGDLISVFRKGGARAVIRIVGEGGSAGLLVDRNVRRQHGGVYAPFMGLDARTSPLPALLALRHDVPVFPVFLVPSGTRYRIWFGPDLTEDLPPGPRDAQIHALLTRINQALEEVIRDEPRLWNWTLKRFKSRPHETQGDYPPYSEFDPV